MTLIETRYDLQYKTNVMGQDSFRLEMMSQVDTRAHFTHTLQRSTHSRNALGANSKCRLNALQKLL